MRIVIVGGVAGGAACAARLRRLTEEAEIVMLDQGPYVSFANCGLPYFLSGVIAERGSLLVSSRERFERTFNIRVRLNTKVTSIDRVQRCVTLQDAAGESQLNYDVLILSPGSEPIVPPFARGLKNVFTLRSVPDAEAVKTALCGRGAQRVLIVGGGFIGLECAENLKAAGLEVTLVEAAAQVLAPLDFEMAQFVHEELTGHGIQLRLNCPLQDLKENADGTLTAVLKGKSEIFDGVLLAIGGRPASALARDCGLELDARGLIKTDGFMRTLDERIYALGDAAEIGLPLMGGRGGLALAGPANKEARALTADIGRRFLGLKLSVPEYAGALGASAVKVFSLEAASVGLNEKTLQAAARPHTAVWLHPTQHAGCYPDARPCHLKVVYEEESGRLLGAQAVGAGAVKRIEVVSAYLSMGGSVDDLAAHEQVYAPPFSSARDGLNYAGCLMQNIRDGLVKIARFDELETKFKEAFKLDVRAPEMFKARHIPGFVNIPWAQLRHRLDEIPRGRPIVVTCVVGVSAYNAGRILQQAGFAEVYDLSGGVTTYFAAAADFTASA